MIISAFQLFTGDFKVYIAFSQTSTCVFSGVSSVVSLFGLYQET
jgi:hypothetical protein